MMRSLLDLFLIGAGATVCIDLWSVLLKKAFGIRSLDYCLLGRWVLHMPAGRIMHASIGGAAPKAHECAAGWISHYGIGMTFAVTFGAFVGDRWLHAPTLGPALAFGVATVVVPMFVMQPALGMGVAASKAPDPALARLKSLGTHAVFGAGLYVSAELARL